MLCQTIKGEVKYDPTELEIAALIYTTTNFEVYLLENCFTVYKGSPGFGEYLYMAYEEPS